MGCLYLFIFDYASAYVNEVRAVATALFVGNVSRARRRCYCYIVLLILLLLLRLRRRLDPNRCRGRRVEETAPVNLALAPVGSLENVPPMMGGDNWL